MTKPHREGLRISQQLVLTSLVPLVLMSIFATVLSTYVLLQSSLPLLLQENTSRVQTIAADMSANLGAFQHAVDTTAINLARYHGDPEQQRQMIKDFQTYLGRFDGGVTLLNPRGIAIASTVGFESRLGQDYSVYDFYKSVRAYRRTVFTGVVHLKPDDRDMTLIVAPVIANSELVGILLGCFTLEGHNWIRDLGPQYNSKDSRAIVVDVMGNVIFSTDLDPAVSNVKGDPVLWNLVALGEAGSELSGRFPLGNPKVQSFSRLPGMYWGLILQEPFDYPKLFGSPYQVRVISPILIGITVFLVLVLISTNQITKPLTALVQGAIKALDGDPFGSLKMEGPAELQKLTDTFNKLSIRLQEQQAVLRQYANQVVQSQEDERKRLSRELHDGAVQDMVALVQRLELSNQLAESDPEAAQRKLSEVKHLAEGIVSELRRISNDLRPFILDDLGLPAALQSLCDDLDQAMPHASTRLTITGEPIRLDPEVELTVFRMVQESLNNIRKHSSDASKVEVQLIYSEREISAVVSNNGKAIELQEIDVLIREGHLGLAGMLERAHLFGGTINIENDENLGPSILLRLPLSK